MSLGLPGHLVQATLSRALARASHWFGLVCLASAVLAVIILSDGHATGLVWITIAVILGTGGLLALLSKRRTVPLTIAYLLLGSLCTYLYTLSLLGEAHLLRASDLFLIALPKMAMIMVGGAGSSAFIGVLWSTAGFALAEAALVLALVQTHVHFRPDFFTVSAYLLLVGVMLLDGLARRTGRIAQPAIHKAMQDDESRLLRHDLDIRAMGRMHGTTLTQLEALSAARPGVLRAPMRGSIRDTLRTLHDENWLTDVDPRAGQNEPGGDGWLASAVHAAIDRCRDRGLVVEVTGERDALCRLDAVTDRELGLAVQQCLVNVILHAGIVSAEVVFESDAATVSVMVRDGGRGFTESEAGSDRLGLRQSVRRRIERLGGSVAVWSRPGAGTSVLLSVPAPADGADADEDAEWDDRVPR